MISSSLLKVSAGMCSVKVKKKNVFIGHFNASDDSFQCVISSTLKTQVLFLFKVPVDLLNSQNSTHRLHHYLALYKERGENLSGPNSYSSALSQAQHTIVLQPAAPAHAAHLTG